MKQLEMNDKLNAIINSEKPVLIDFYAAGCERCQALAPILQQVKQSLGERVVIIKIDIDKNQAAAKNYFVWEVPTMMIFQNGKQLWRQLGVISRQDIIRTLLEKSN